MLEKLAVAAVVRVVRGDFGPESFGVVHVMNMRELMENDIIAERLRNFHEADIERNRAGARAGAPTRVGMRKADAGIAIAIFSGPELEAIRQIIAGFLHQNTLLGVAGALSGRVFDRQLITNSLAGGIEPALGKKNRGMWRCGDG